MWYASSTKTDHLGYALVFATLIHGVLILSLGFVPTTMSPPAERHQTSLRVLLIPPTPEPSPQVEKPEFLAPTRQKGGGNQKHTHLPETLSPARPPSVQPSAPRAVPMPNPPTPPARPRLTARQPPPPTPAVAPPPRQMPTQSRPPVTAAQLLDSSEEIVRLTEALERKSEAYARRPRRQAVSASTKEYKYASYLEAWRRKVERIGNLNYPDEAKRNRLYGNLMLQVSVRTDGSVEGIRLLHSSGHKVLDDAAMRIVRLAAPYAPFPADIRAETDILDINRTWQFLSNNRLSWD